MTKQRPKPPQKNRLQFGKKEPSNFKERGGAQVSDTLPIEYDSVSRLELDELFGVSMDNKGYE